MFACLLFINVGLFIIYKCLLVYLYNYYRVESSSPTVPCSFYPEYIHPCQQMKLFLSLSRVYSSLPTNTIIFIFIQSISIPANKYNYFYLLKFNNLFWLREFILVKGCGHGSR